MYWLIDISMYCIHKGFLLLLEILWNGSGYLKAWVRCGPYTEALWCCHEDIEKSCVMLFRNFKDSSYVLTVAVVWCAPHCCYHFVRLMKYLVCCQQHFATWKPSMHIWCVLVMCSISLWCVNLFIMSGPNV